MAKLDKNYKKLIKTYDKKLKKLHKTAFTNMQVPTDYFVMYLRFLRDMKLLSQPFKEKLEADRLDLATIITAVNEFDAFDSCINKYYDVKDGVVFMSGNQDEAATREKCQKETAAHWETFWELVKMYLEDWSINA